MPNKRADGAAHTEPAAGNGILNRRWFLESAVMAGAGAAAGAGGFATAAAAAPLEVAPWSKTPGAGFTAYGMPSHFESKVVRTWGAPANPAAPNIGTARTPHQYLHGVITPSGLHYDRSHDGTPDIDPDKHLVVIHGLVRQPLEFTLEALSRYPMVTRVAFLECGGNSGGLAGPTAPVGDVQTLHGLMSCNEWTGVPLSTLLDEAGVLPAAKWILAEGADAASVSRSIPLSKAMDDCLVCLYQNGERIRPSNGYPVRLLVPGYSGNMNTKWLRRIKLVDGPIMTKDETSKYTILLPSGKAWQFVFPLEVKSVITQPSPGLSLKGPGFYEISGLAWSGNGSITKVDVTADGGKSWAPAALQAPVLPKAFTRFRAAWNWDGGEAILQSRSVDDTGMVQPTRDQLIAERGLRGAFHWNGITSWKVDAKGEVTHVFA